jgi:hypothetical protein
MDLFICENFFDKPLDVAFVVDPCRHDRAFFFWEEGAKKTTRRAAGFYLFASRFREFELSQFAEWLEDPIMSSDPRFRGAAHNPYPGPVVQLGSTLSPWIGVGVVATLALQLSMTTLIAWRAIGPVSSLALSGEVRALQQKIDELEGARHTESQLDAKIEVLDKVVGLGPNAAQDLVTSLAERTSEVEQLKGYLRAHETANQALEDQLAVLKAEFREADSERNRLQSQLKSVLARRESTAAGGVHGAERTGGQLAETESVRRWPLSWIVSAAAIGILFAAVIAATFTRAGRRSVEPVEATESEVGS